MLGWLKNLLRRWLEVEPPVPQVSMLHCMVDGKLTQMAVIGVVGLKLQVSDGRRTRIVGPAQVPDHAQFWAAWRQRNIRVYRWEDGSEYRPWECQ